MRFFAPALKPLPLQAMHKLYRAHSASSPPAWSHRGMAPRPLPAPPPALPGEGWAGLAKVRRVVSYTPYPRIVIPDFCPGQGAVGGLLHPIPSYCNTRLLPWPRCGGWSVTPHTLPLQYPTSALAKVRWVVCYTQYPPIVIPDFCPGQGAVGGRRSLTPHTLLL